ncbi:hypothetical protein ACVWZN_000327 [Lysobacter sp. HA35]
MTRELRRHRAATGLPQAPHGDTGSEQRRLGEFGGVEPSVGTVLAERPEIDTGALAGLGERGGDERIGRCELREHADGLRALAGKDECEWRTGHATARLEERAIIRTKASRCLYSGVRR